LLGVKSLAAVSAGNTESEVLAQELESVGNQLRAVEARLTEVEKIIERLEAAALTTARALEEVSTHWDKVYRAMRRAE
jgi:chaperonin cofactor prefoldin